jgi:hypothetical protein
MPKTRITLPVDLDKMQKIADLRSELGERPACYSEITEHMVNLYIKRLEKRLRMKVKANE